MKRVSGRAEGACRASVPAVTELLRAVDRYSEWHPEGVRRIVVLERDAAGDPVILEVTLRAAIGPVARDVELRLEVNAAQPNRITLTRLPNQPEDPERFVATWHLDGAGTAQTTILLELEADLDLPRLAPVGELANNLARAFVAAAITAIQSQDAGSSPPRERRSRYIRSVP